MARIDHRSRMMAGLSVLELLVAINILGITLALAAPNMRRFLARQQMTVESLQLMTTLNYARTMAITMNNRVVLCPSVNLEHCSDQPDWHHGLMVFVDSNWNRELDPDETLLLAKQGTGNPISIKTTRGRRRIAYHGTGLSPGSNVTFSICDSRGLAQPKAVIISNTGRSRTAERRPNGAEIQCPSG